MTGIGFLGAGAILKEGLTIRGLTTAASIWITAAIGVLAGIGFYFPLVVSVILTLGVLSVFRWIQIRMPAEAYYHFDVRFARASGMTESALRVLVEQHGFSPQTSAIGSRAKAACDAIPWCSGRYIARARRSSRRRSIRTKPCSSTTSRRWTEQNRKIR